MHAVKFHLQLSIRTCILGVSILIGHHKFNLGMVKR